MQCALVCVWCLDTSLELVPAVVYPAASDSGWCESRSFGYVVGGTFTCFVASAAAQVKVLRKRAGCTNAYFLLSDIQDSFPLAGLFWRLAHAAGRPQVGGRRCSPDEVSHELCATRCSAVCCVVEFWSRHNSVFS